LFASLCAFRAPLQPLAVWCTCGSAACRQMPPTQAPHSRPEACDVRKAAVEVIQHVPCWRGSEAGNTLLVPDSPAERLTEGREPDRPLFAHQTAHNWHLRAGHWPAQPHASSPAIKLHRIAHAEYALLSSPPAAAHVPFSSIEDSAPTVRLHTAPAGLGVHSGVLICCWGAGGVTRH
jgi:hypothetical protein